MLHLGAARVELDTAYWAAVIFLEPELDAGSIESMLAGELAAKLTILARLEADVAIGHFTSLLLRQVFNEIF
jgi:hypothetical protein